MEIQLQLEILFLKIIFKNYIYDNSRIPNEFHSIIISEKGNFIVKFPVMKLYPILSFKTKQIYIRSDNSSYPYDEFDTIPIKLEVKFKPVNQLEVEFKEDQSITLYEFIEKLRIIVNQELQKYETNIKNSYEFKIMNTIRNQKGYNLGNLKNTDLIFFDSFVEKYYNNPQNLLHTFYGLLDLGNNKYKILVE